MKTATRTRSPLERRGKRARPTKGKATATRAKRTVLPHAPEPPAPTPLPQARPVRETPKPPERKPGYQQAIALYEGAILLLQRHEYAAAADQFRAVIQGYPDERELLERARLFLRVCEREVERQPKAEPRTPEERIYAATMSLNDGDVKTALDYLERALEESPTSDHGHYIMAVALSDAGDMDRALDHLKRSLELNHDNRSAALQDPDLEALRLHDDFAAVLDATAIRRPASLLQERERKARRR